MVNSGSHYVPDRGHIVWLDFNPQAGREQAGRRPALVLSPALYNGRSGLALICPITNQVKGYPFEVALPTDFTLSGVVLSDHIKSQDWRVRRAEYICTIPDPQLEDVIARLSTLLR